jgi:hypothetical protein
MPNPNKKRKKKPSTPAKKQWVESNLPGKGGKQGPKSVTPPPPKTTVEPQVVVLQPQVITWAPAKTALTYGQLLSAEHLNAQALGGAVPTYQGADKLSVAIGAKLTAGSHTIAASTLATSTHAASTPPVSQTFAVAKGTPTLTWKTPAAVTLTGTPPTFKLTAGQLNATVVDGEADLGYTPALGTALTNGTHFLRAVHPASANFKQAEISVRLLVYRSAKTKQGFETVRKGQGWAPGKGLPTDVKKRWDDDEGKVKSQGQQLMQQMQDLTVDELKDFLDKQVPDKNTDYVYQGGKYPNQMWKFPNGLQVRVKPQGDAFSSEPKFCIEIVSESIRTQGKFTGKGDQNAILCKLSIDGSPSPKGPGDTNLHGIGGDVETDNYVYGSCQATHPVCRAKLTPQLTWAPPAPIAVGTKLEVGVQLNAVIVEGEGTLVYNPAAGLSPSNAGVFPLQAKLPASKRYKEAIISVNITVQAPPKPPAQKTAPNKAK